jgi:hypothetical protein
VAHGSGGGGGRAVIEVACGNWAVGAAPDDGGHS